MTSAFNSLDTDLTAPNRLRRMLLRCWDSDTGNGTLTPELWHVFCAAARLELEQREFVRKDQLNSVLRAMEVVWNCRHEPYDKDRWRTLDDAMRDAFGAGSGWDRGT